ncbi:uncharacterized protein SPSK_08681 [Sporothrix schenckii 1099-18]|uniref:Transcription factor domain-containing protein n=2 Tax=Sporothrix schenckii TaxID=29908 RepID=U7Q6B2_SPOS1|nr:uncharacterized protein SPSK_08681 [Sporothrix schenckii 1099-18]ERT03384.1 hypothetical protein HMPREF1624_01698 [Sporothrix schenckii ATCC 58251]KJR84168.1 hypothetical protein SPSK_08681 [Sporothrix schenckii 1099-18]
MSLPLFLPILDPVPLSVPGKRAAAADNKQNSKAEQRVIEKTDRGISVLDKVPPAAAEPPPSGNGPGNGAGTGGTDTRESSPKPRAIDYIPEIALADLSDGQETDGSGDEEGDEETTETPPSSAKQTPPRAVAQPPSKRRRQSDAKRAQRQLAWFYHKYRPRNAPVVLTEPHRRYLEDVGALLELPKATADALLSIYVSLLDDLLPIVDGASVFRGHSNGHTSIYLVRAMCLVACKTSQAAPFLRLSDNGPALAPLDFAARLLTGLDAAIKADLEPDRITKVQILALMHLHNDGTTGTRRAASCLAQAVCEAWSLSIHWRLPTIPDQGTTSTDYLWWSLRNLDRLSKPIMAAAPFLINDSDVGLPRITAIGNSSNYRAQVMALATALGDLLATATTIFKASSKATVDDCQEFPTFATVTSGAGVRLDHFHQSHRDYLEIWYCVAAMLSCRYSGPATAPYQRRLDAAVRALSLITDGQHTHLPPLPLIPYALSMATTVVYRALRDKQRDAVTSRRDLARCCEALDGLARLWTSVAAVAKLARRLLRLLGLRAGERQPGPNHYTQTNVDGPNGLQTTTAVPAPDWQYANIPLATAGVAPALDFETQLAAADSWSASSSGGGLEGLDSLEGFANFESPGTYPQFDAAFHNLFDFAMPPAFREQDAWAFFPTAPATAAAAAGASVDGSSTGGDFPMVAPHP